jgi:hypothetical protein
MKRDAASPSRSQPVMHDPNCMWATGAAGNDVIMTSRTASPVSMTQSPAAWDGPAFAFPAPMTLVCGVAP